VANKKYRLPPSPTTSLNDITKNTKLIAPINPKISTQLDVKLSLLTENRKLVPIENPAIPKKTRNMSDKGEGMLYIAAIVAIKPQIIPKATLPNIPAPTHIKILRDKDIETRRRAIKIPNPIAKGSNKGVIKKALIAPIKVPSKTLKNKPILKKRRLINMPNAVVRGKANKIRFVKPRYQRCGIKSGAP
jgi:hypothetical protein